MINQNIKIHIVPTEGIPSIFDRKTTVFLLDSGIVNHSIVDDINSRLLTENVSYRLIISNSIGQLTLANYIGGNLLCPLYDIKNNVRSYLIADVENESIEAGVFSMLDAVARYSREYLEDILIAASFNKPTIFNDEIVFKPSDRNGSPLSALMGCVFSSAITPLCSTALGLDLNVDLDSSSSLADGNSSDGFEINSLSADYSDTSADKYMSSKRKKYLLSKLPEKVSERFIKKNPDCKKEIEAIIASVSHQDLQELVLELITRQKGAMEIFDFERLSAASEYKLCVKHWDKSIKDFDQKFYYCLYLKDNSGKEIPVHFQNHPAYCLYIMYVIDRSVRGENASYLSIRENKDEFIRLYQVLFGYPKAEAENKYRTFAYRINKEGVPTRKGRYDDYLKDIDETIVSLVGRADSIPLKLRDGGHLEIKPSRIELDQHLRSFKFK